ncbi:hypothetical protein ESCO_001133 [Escovopsis weberi]|uniref:Uncharacterized protein n=1 Tax=Escovopsis weberi TaxID=150374 RepID=A0A0M8N4N8_ESCWE|nr:hypothetical protein ESCO_001133 [Escovopsis weberi]
MAPATGAPPSRRTTELDRALPQLPTGYRTDANVAPTTGSPPGAASMQPGQPPGTPSMQQYRGADRASQLDGTAPSVDPGRNSPQPSTTTQERESEGDKAFKELLTKYKHVKRLYFDGRAQIEQLSGQVEHLQNAVANQRMSSSRTALDDNEYSTRFSRLNGAINNLSFNIRKDWRSVPPWLEKYVSADALKTGKQEMTAVGRAVISRWVLEELFNKCFHPDLETTLSAQLKDVELGIRASAPTMHSQEEVDAHTAKVVSWRMTTLDGLQQRLTAAGTTENRQLLITKATSNLTACLYQHLSNPPPHGVEGSTSTIVELAVSIAANLPKESRDVSVTYPMPGDVLQPHLMEVEKAGLPALEGQKTKTEGDAEAEKKESFSSDASRVRFAAFLALEVKGRQVLMKAPVWTL